MTSSGSIGSQLHASHTAVKDMAYPFIDEETRLGPVTCAASPFPCALPCNHGV